MMEYAVGLAAVIAGLIGMQVYFSRGIKGNLKKQTDKIKGEAQLFSERYSSYDKIEETLSYNSTRVTNETGEMREEYETNIVSRVVSGNINPSLVSGNAFFDSGYEFAGNFSDVEVREDYSLNSPSSVVDNFSDKKLNEDKLLGDD